MRLPVQRPPAVERVLKEDGGRGVYLVREAGNLAVVKSWPLGPWLVCKTLLGIAQPQRQRRGARLLAAAGIPVARPLGLAIAWRGGPRLELRNEWVAGEPLGERLARLDARGASDLGAAMGALLARAIGAGLVHRDGKVSNFVVAEDGALVAIDPVGVRRARRGEAGTERMLERLACELEPGPVTASFLAAARATIRASAGGRSR
jgi:hypothetical protein